MKNIKYITITMAVFAMLIVSSCKKEFYTDANKNPNAPPSVLPAALLSSAEGGLAYTQGGIHSIFVTMLDQQTFGASRQAAAYYNYIITGQDLDDVWSNWYTNVLAPCNDLMTQADAKGYNAYSGIARLLMAYSLQVNVDVWGDMPYSQALKGVANLNPSYDAASNIYTSIGGLVDDGIAKLNLSDAGVLTPGGEDVIYGGDASLWIKFGHAIKARLAIHQSKGNAAKANEALTEIASALSGNSNNAQYGFGSTATSANPWYQFNNERGDISYSGSTLASMLTARNDPRYAIYLDSANDGAGFGLGKYFGDISSPVELICYDEILFMSAEAKLRTGNTAGAQTDFAAGIKANMKKLGIDTTSINSYLAAHGTLPVTVADAIDTVATQAYLALYLNPEAWTLWRRTNSPALTAVAGSQGVARRLRYPQSEYFYNAGNTPSATLWSPKLFWDN